MTAQRLIQVASDVQGTIDFQLVFDRTPAAMAVVRVLPAKIVVLMANATFVAELGSQFDIAGSTTDELFLSDTALALDGVVRRAASFGRAARVMLESFGVGAERHEALAAPLDGIGDLVLLSVSQRTTRGPRVSATTLEQLEALGEGLIFVFDLARGRMMYMAAELAHLIGHGMQAELDLDAVRALIHPDDYEPLARYITGLGPMGAPGVSSVVVRVARPPNGWRWLELRGRALRKRDGEVRTVLGVAVDITERREMSRALDRAAREVLRAGEQERRRVARNLHDSTAQHMVAIDLGLSTLERRLPASEATAEILHDMRESLAAAHREIRTYSYLLHPPQLQRLGLEATLRRFVEGFGRRSELTVEVQAPVEAQPLTGETELALFRVAQEAIMNVHRHAEAQHAIVRLIRSADSLVLEVEDDGVGLADDAVQRMDGVGIPGMQARMAQIGGTLELSTCRAVCACAPKPRYRAAGLRARESA